MLIRELIPIQERVDRDDFVLKLTAGVADPGGTLGNYVVTKDLVGNFNDALDFIKGAVEPPPTPPEAPGERKGLKRKFLAVVLGATRGFAKSIGAYLERMHGECRSLRNIYRIIGANGPSNCFSTGC